MNFKKGRNRFVVFLPTIGIAIKFPIIHLLRAIKPLFKDLPKGKKWTYIKMYFGYPVEVWGGFRYQLFSGLYANYIESKFYKKTNNPFLQPTYFSLFGLINIQELGKPCEFKTVDFWCQLYELTDGKVFDDSHHFGNPDNFCFDGGKLKILDYGSEGTHAVITEFGEKIIRYFDPNFDWEKKKKALLAQKTT